jgi:GNAT superfamily N-acetyltransferase
MIDPDVRRAEPGDAGPLQILEAEARAALIGTRGGDRWLQEHRLIGDGWFDAIASRDVLVAVLDVGDGETPLVVGYLVLDLALPIARVDQVYVTPDARELGFGDALLETATAAATDAGAHVLEGEALPGDRDTKNLYERAGITARLITVSRRLH